MIRTDGNLPDLELSTTCKPSQVMPPVVYSIGVVTTAARRATFKTKNKHGRNRDKRVAFI
jgi:hypothetical protein